MRKSCANSCRFRLSSRTCHGTCAKIPLAALSAAGILVRQYKERRCRSHAVRHPLLSRRRHGRFLVQRTGRRGHDEIVRRAGQACPARSARPGGAAAADHGRDHAAVRADIVEPLHPPHRRPVIGPAMHQQRERTLVRSLIHRIATQRVTHQIVD